MLRSSTSSKELDLIRDQADNLQKILSLNSQIDDCLYSHGDISRSVDILDIITNLHEKYQTPVIDHIFKEAESRREYIVNELCARLERSKNYNQSEIKTNVALLGRCGRFSDRELRLKYLQARDNWFNNSCEEQEASFDKVVSVHCEGLPFIFEEYKMIFGSEQDGKFIVDREKDDGVIINSWLMSRATIFLSSLEVYLKAINESDTKTPTMVGDTMKKCFELTDTLGTIGFDFSSQLIPLFNKSIMEELKNSIDKATTKFEQDFSAMASKSVESLLLPVDDEILRISDIRPEEKLPKSIDYYPIFKVYFLHLIDSLRWLQTTRTVLSPISLCLDTYATLNGALIRVMNALAMVMNMDDNTNNIHLTKIAICLVTQVLPFIASYCDRIFPEKVVLSAVGLSKSNFKNLILKDPQKVTDFRLHARRICEPLRHIMPALLKTLGT